MINTFNLTAEQRKKSFELVTITDKKLLPRLKEWIDFIISQYHYETLEEYECHIKTGLKSIIDKSILIINK